MPHVNHVAVIDYDLCRKCPFCVRVCPTNAISWEANCDPVVKIDGSNCLDCTLCMTRCPHHAITMHNRDEPLAFGVDWTMADPEEVTRICHTAHMHADQIICFCRQTRQGKWRRRYYLAIALRSSCQLLPGFVPAAEFFASPLCYDC